jgi:septum formation protein
MKEQRTIILASASPRRKELLEKTGLAFKVDPSDCAEDRHNGLPPESLAKAISINKAALAAVKYPDAIVIAADTFGVIRGKIIGKPETAAEAIKMLRRLSGKSHRVITGLTVIDTARHKMITRVVETRVYIKKMTEAEIQNYVATGEPLDKAGAYAIQGRGAFLVEKIAGDYYNVVGLPLQTLAAVLKELGVEMWGNGSILRQGAKR